MSFPSGGAVKNRLQLRRCSFDPWVGKIPWRRAWQATSVFLPGKSHGQRSLAGYSPWGDRESDMAYWLNNNLPGLTVYFKTLFLMSIYLIFYFLNILQFIIFSCCWTSKLFPVVLLLSCQVMSISFVNPWTVAYQATLSMGFPRQEYWSGLPLPSYLSLS